MSEEVIEKREFFYLDPNLLCTKVIAENKEQVGKNAWLVPNVGIRTLGVELFEDLASLRVKAQENFYNIKSRYLRIEANYNKL